MNLDPLRQIFHPLFGLERRETTKRFLYAILTGGILIDLLLIVIRLLGGSRWTHLSLQLLMILLPVFGGLLLLVWGGYIRPASLLLTGIVWLAVTSQAWIADGVRDPSMYAYFLIVFVAALLISWRVSAFFSVISVLMIWSLALLEQAGMRAPRPNAPLEIARDLTAIFLMLFVIIYLVINAFRRLFIAVQESEEKFRKVFHVSPVAIAIVSLSEGRLLDANEAYWKLSGFDPDLALGKTTRELGAWISEGDREQFVASIREQGSIHDTSYRFRNRSGAYRTTLAFYELIEFEHVPAILAMFYDITDQQETRLALQASEQKYRNFIEQSVEGIWLLALDEPISTRLPPEEQVRLIYERAYVAECNDTLARMYGYPSAAELVGTRLMALQNGPEVDPANFHATLQLVREEYRSANRETSEKTRDGKTVYFLNNAIGVIQDGYLTGIWGTQLDITALKIIEDALRRSEARTRALLNAIPDMIFELHRDGTILQFISSSSTSKPLLPPDQFLGKRIQAVLPDSVANQTIFALERALESAQVHAFEYQLFQDGETKTFEARITPLGVDTALAIVRDVSLQNSILAEREQLISELEKKNAELEQFTYTASHDLKSPLITIKGFLGFLRKDAERGNLARLEADIGRISDAADKMQRLLNDLLEISRVGRIVNAPQSIDMNELLSEVLELVHGRIHSGNIRVIVSDGLSRVSGDRSRLMEVWQNLIDNAAKFMGDQPDPYIEIGQVGKADDNPTTFYVRDNGMGIDPAFHHRIFGLFDKLDPHSEGTGVGLALVKRIVEFHGGSVWVESDVGKGTTFYFTLPRVENGGWHSP